MQGKNKKIEFCKILNSKYEVQDSTNCVMSYKNIELIIKDYGPYDIMLAYNDIKEEGIIYLGFFNEGVR